MSFTPADVYWIEDEEAFELLADSTRLEIIELALVPRSVTEMAKAMGVPRTRLYHHIKLLEEAGMIAVADTRPAGAMTEKIYQTAAKGFQPSKAFLESALPRSQAEAVLASILGSARADFLRAVEDGLVSLSEPRELRTVSLSRRLMRLNPTRLRQLVAELETVLDRYDEERDEGDDAITVGVLHMVHPSSRHVP